MEDKRGGNGGHSTKAQRLDDKRLLTKTQLQDVYESLNPYLPEALQQLGKAIKRGEKWAIELWFKYYYSLPKQTIDNNLQVTDFNLKDILKFDKS